MNYFVTIPEGQVRDTFFPTENISLIESCGRVCWNTAGRKLTNDEIIASIGDSEVYVTGWGSPRLDADIIEAAPGLKYLMHLCGTVVPFVSDALWEKGIKVMSGNDYFAESVAEGVIAYMLTALRRIPFYSGELKNRLVWNAGDRMNNGLLDKTVGIIGYGAVAKHLVRMLQPFRVKILISDIYPIPDKELSAYNMTQVSSDEVFSHADIISVHVSLNDKTVHLIGKRQFELIKDGALFINTARGAVIDQNALIEELEKHRFEAFFDVYEYAEPPKPDSRLYTLPNVYMMPHMAGPTIDRRRYITEGLIREAEAYENGSGKLPHEITRAKAEQMSRS